MPDKITEFLSTTQSAGWARSALAGDASTRRYERLCAPSGETAILMDDSLAPPENIEKFAYIATALRDAGLAAPQIYHTSAADGLMILEDLGENDFAKVIRKTPSSGDACYSAATEVLLQIHQVAPLSLPQLSAENAAQWLEPLGTWYCAKPIALCAIQDAMTTAFQTLGLTADTLALRDFHAENLIWRPKENGIQKVGLLDFQDAFYAPAGYDLASLTRDARRDVDQELVNALTAKIADAEGRNLADYSAQVACLAVQRNLRILGIFASLAKRYGKTGYNAYVPRVWSYLQHDMAHPALSELRKSVVQVVPEPTSAHLAQWRK